jgi:hypothetical protein
MTPPTLMYVHTGLEEVAAAFRAAEYHRKEDRKVQDNQATLVVR